ncbi:MAG: DUF4258 domain-containing protein [Candidatus Hodarchaeota archaeon]
MVVRFTQHALERMKNRDISRKDVLDTINSPDRILKDAVGNDISQRVIGGYLIRVFHRKANGDILILTVYKTSKISKYK